MDIRRLAGLAVLGLVPILAASGPGLARPGQSVKPDLAAAVAATLPNWPRNDIVVTATLKNTGDAPAPKSVCMVYIRNAHPPRQTVKRIRKEVRALNPGDEFAFSFKVRLSQGMYEIEAIADLGDKIAEKDEENNKARLTISGR